MSSSADAPSLLVRLTSLSPSLRVPGAALSVPSTLNRAGLSAGVQQKLQRAQKIPSQRYEEATSLGRACSEQSASLFAGATCILTPSSPGYAPLLAEKDPGDSCFSKLWTILGMPSVSIPVPVPGPLPIGLEVICPKGQDTLALQAAQRMSEILNQKP